ncbi:uncharacterized protein [Apostichopus japonicus]|uniref:uncharacterized protein isoform X2 n=1 Tax=Stichopus japonicus TaxID=307972 RepID=UPI003AB2D752
MAENEIDSINENYQKVNLQLKVIQERNAEILQHLAEAKAVAAEGEFSLPSHLSESITKAQDISQRVNETVDSQCDILKQSVQELRRLPTDSEEDSSSGENSIQHQFRSQLDRNVSLQKEKAELELSLAEKVKLADVAKEQNGELQEELQSTKDSMQKLVESYEENTTKAEEQLKKLQDDLQKAQEKSSEYQSLLEKNSRDKSKKSTKTQNGSTSGVKNAPRTTAAVHASSSSSSSSSSSLPNPSDIDDRYMSLLEENRRYREEIQRMKAENTYLIKQNRQVIGDMDMMQKHVATCTSQRQELQIRLRRQQEEHQRLTKTMTKQAADWINEKKTIKNTENHTKLKKIGAI